MLLRVNDLMMSIFEGDTSLRSRLDDTVESTVYGPYLSTKVKKNQQNKYCWAQKTDDYVTYASLPHLKLQLNSSTVLIRNGNGTYTPHHHSMLSLFLLCSVFSVKQQITDIERAYYVTYDCGIRLNFQYNILNKQMPVGISTRYPSSQYSFVTHGYNWI